MINLEDEETRKLGCNLFTELKDSIGGSLSSCRERVKLFIRSM
jgi:hypothetical protein